MLIHEHDVANGVSRAVKHQTQRLGFPNMIACFGFETRRSALQVLGCNRCRRKAMDIVDRVSRRMQIPEKLQWRDSPIGSWVKWWVERRLIR